MDAFWSLLPAIEAIPNVTLTLPEAALPRLAATRMAPGTPQ
jgi:hypothetical protein